MESPSPTYQCNRCKTDKPESGFYFKKGKIQLSWCKECYRLWYHDRNGGLVDRACDWCSMTMTITGRRAAESKVFCSRVCKGRHRNAALAAERLASKKERPCAWCGEIIPPEMRADASFCSESCNSAAHNVTRKIAKRAARYRTDQEADSLISRAQIAERDGYRCQLCGGQVAMWRKHPDPLCASIDHVVPLARFGGNDDANLQLAHLKCNLSKRAGDRPEATQPPLWAV